MHPIPAQPTERDDRLVAQRLATRDALYRALAAVAAAIATVQPPDDSALSEALAHVFGELTEARHHVERLLRSAPTPVTDLPSAPTTAPAEAALLAAMVGGARLRLTCPGDVDPGLADRGAAHLQTARGSIGPVPLRSLHELLRHRRINWVMHERPSDLAETEAVITYAPTLAGRREALALLGVAAAGPEADA